MDVKCSGGYVFGVDFDKFIDCSYDICDNYTRQLCRKCNSTCVGKADFGSQTMAEREGRIMSCNAYKCNYCGGWHIGRGL